MGREEQFPQSDRLSADWSCIFDVELFGISEDTDSGSEFGSILLKYFDIDVEDIIYFDDCEVYKG